MITLVDEGTNAVISYLSDAETAYVEEEENSEYEAVFTYPVDGLSFDDIKERSLIKTKVNPYSSTEQLFRIYSISRPLRGSVEFRAKHISYDLSGAIMEIPFKATNAQVALASLKTGLINGDKFTFWTDVPAPTETTELAIESPSSARSVLGGGGSDSILNKFGGYFEWDNYIVKLHQNRGYDNGVALVYGRDLIDGNQEKNIEQTYTAVLPFWKKEETLVKTDSPVVVQGYDYLKIYPLDCSSEFEEQPTKSQLQTYAQKYIEKEKVGSPKINITVTYEQMKKVLFPFDHYKHYGNSVPNNLYPTVDVNRLVLGDIIHVVFDKTQKVTTARVTKTKYNILEDRYDSISLGDPVQNLSNRLTDQGIAISKLPINTLSKIDEAIQRATKLITGNLGGYVVIRNSNPELHDDHPDEILILDENSGGVIGQSEKIWRWNMGGLGYSDDYGTNYTLAITQDGAIVADFMTTGTLNAGVAESDLVITGVVQSQNYSHTSGTYSSNGTQINISNGTMTSENFAIDGNGTVHIRNALRVGETIESDDYTADSGTYSSEGIQINMTGGGAIRAKNFAIDSEGNAYFRGTISGSGTTIGSQTDRSDYIGLIRASTVWVGAYHYFNENGVYEMDETKITGYRSWEDLISGTYTAVFG